MSTKIEKQIRVSSTPTPNLSLLKGGLPKRKCGCDGASGKEECEACGAGQKHKAKTETGAGEDLARFGHNFERIPVYASAQSSGPASAQESEGEQKTEPAAKAQRGVVQGKAKAIPSDKQGPEAMQPVEEAAKEPEEEEEEEGKGSGAGKPATAQETAAPEISKSKGITFKTIFYDMPPVSTSMVGKTKCPAVKPRNPGFVGPIKSTAAQIAAMSACNWGITEPDPLKVSTMTCKDGTDWKLRVTNVSSTIRTFSRHLAGEVEPTVGNSTSANFCTQVSDLDALGNCPGSFYMLAAVRAHEAVHVDEWKTSAGSDWPAQQAIIDGLSVPASGATKNQAAATKSMRSSAAFQNALLTSRASGNYPAFWGIPDPNTNTNAAEQVIVAPRIRQLCVNARSKGWTPSACPVCVANGIT